MPIGLFVPSWFCLSSLKEKLFSFAVKKLVVMYILFPAFSPSLPPSKRVLLHIASCSHSERPHFPPISARPLPAPPPTLPPLSDIWLLGFGFGFGIARQTLPERARHITTSDIWESIAYQYINISSHKSSRGSRKDQGLCCTLACHSFENSKRLSSQVYRVITSRFFIEERGKMILFFATSALSFPCPFPGFKNQVGFCTSIMAFRHAATVDMVASNCMSFGSS
jgi:hypothetical protein